MNQILTTFAVPSCRRRGQNIRNPGVSTRNAATSVKATPFQRTSAQVARRLAPGEPQVRPNRLVHNSHQGLRRAGSAARKIFSIVDHLSKLSPGGRGDTRDLPLKTTVPGYRYAHPGYVRASRRNRFASPPLQSDSSHIHVKAHRCPSCSSIRRSP
jgi:hypothetical protein